VHVSTRSDDAYEDFNCSGEVFHNGEGFERSQKAVITLFVKLNKIATETFEMLKTTYGEGCLSRTSMSDGIKGSKKGESHYKMMTGKAILQLPGQKN
jgi:hypothetical protein